MNGPKRRSQGGARDGGLHANTGSSPRAPWGKIAPYVFISVSCFFCGVGLLILMLWKAETLVRFGLTGQVYYVVLLPLGLSAAGFLFGVLRSFATYRGNHFGGAVELGGPVVAFVLVVVGGFLLVPTLSTFALTVYVHGKGGPHDLVLRNSGHVLLDLGADRRREPISDTGQAYFPAIPANFRGQEVFVGIDSEDFEVVGQRDKQRLDGASLYVPVQKRSKRIVGRVQDENGNAVSGAAIDVAGILVQANALGEFEVIVPGDRLRDELEVRATAPGHNTKSYKVVPGANPATITLRREP